MPKKNNENSAITPDNLDQITNSDDQPTEFIWHLPCSGKKFSAKKYTEIVGICRDATKLLDDATNKISRHPNQGVASIAKKRQKITDSWKYIED